MRKLTRRKPARRADEAMEYVKLAKEPGGSIFADVHWSFDNPHQSGHVVGTMVRAIVRGLHEQNPKATRAEIYEQLVNGLNCKVTEEFLKGGEDGMSIRTH